LPHVVGLIRVPGNITVLVSPDIRSAAVLVVHPTKLIRSARVTTGALRLAWQHSAVGMRIVATGYGKGEKGTGEKGYPDGWSSHQKAPCAAIPAQLGPSMGATALSWLLDRAGFLPIQ
jgi:hypothetical protein